MTARLAVYYAPPPGSALAMFAACWLGRDPADDRPMPRPAIAGLTPQRLAAITAAPGHYGFHGTLKPPFVLATGRTAEAAHAAVAAFACRQRSFTLPALQLASLGGFLGLVPARPSPALHELAAACVVEFDAFRAPPDAGELAKRRGNGLTPRQETLLTRWGYPYVNEEFRFHLTLTDRLAAAERAVVQAALAPLCLPFCASPLTIDALTVFEQPDRASAFRMTGRYPFGG